jgi:Response regulator receiver domain
MRKPGELRSAGSKTPVIFLGARAQECDGVRGLDLGANDYVVKPFSPDELMPRVRRLLRDREDGCEQQKQFEDELRAAAAVQESLFPRHHPSVEGLESSAACRPAKGVSGDYYDFIPLDAGGFATILAAATLHTAAGPVPCYQFRAFEVCQGCATATGGNNDRGLVGATHHGSGVSFVYGFRISGRK